eukprot:878761_1
MADDEYEYYDEEYEYEYGDGNDNDEWYYNESSKSMASPPKNVLEILATNYSQQLLIDPEDLKVEPEEDNIVNDNIFPTHTIRTRGRSRNYSYRKSRHSTQTTKQSPNMTAINIIKGLFKNEKLNQLQPPIDKPSELELISTIL